MKIDYAKYINNERTIILLVTFAFIIIMQVLFLITFKNTLKEINFSNKQKIYLKGMITNPEALILSAEINTKNNKYEDAIVDLKLARKLEEIYKIENNEIEKKIIHLQNIVDKNKPN